MTTTICLYTHIYIYGYMYLLILVSVKVQLLTYSQNCVNIHVSIDKYTSIYTYICTCVCACTYMCTNHKGTVYLGLRNIYHDIFLASY